MERSPLAPCLEDIHNIDEISHWITATLKENNQAGSYGLVVGMSAKNENFPAVVFGFPNVDTAVIDSEGMGLPYYVRPDRMYNCETNHRACPWAPQPIQDDIVTLSALSIGGTSCLEDAGSFGGFLVDNNGDLHGMTARHCVPGMRDGDSVSSPSSLEVTARFQRIVNYTRYQQEKFVRQVAKDREAEQILNRYRVVDRADGVECNIDGNPRTVLLEGPKIGTLQRIALENKAGLLAAYNAWLLAAGEKQFPAVSLDVISRLDYAIFSVEAK